MIYLIVVDFPDWIGLDAGLGVCHNGGLGSLGNDNLTAPGGIVDLWEVGKLLCDLGDICDGPVVGH